MQPNAEFMRDRDTHVLTSHQRRTVPGRSCPAWHAWCFAHAQPSEDKSRNLPRPGSLGGGSCTPDPTPASPKDTQPRSGLRRRIIRGQSHWREQRTFQVLPKACCGEGPGGTVAMLRLPPQPPETIPGRKPGGERAKAETPRESGPAIQGRRRRDGWPSVGCKSPPKVRQRVFWGFPVVSRLRR